MHLLVTTSAGLDENETAIDLAQSPADVVVLSFSDSDLSALAEAWRQAPAELPSLRLASLKCLKHPMSVDLYLERVVRAARAVVVRCLGGLEYWRYGIEQLAALARAKGILLAALPGDARADPRLAAYSTLPPVALARLDDYFREGGTGNAREALCYLGALLGGRGGCAEPVAILPAVGVGADASAVAVDDVLLCMEPAGPCALVVCYRANLLAADTAPILALLRALSRHGLPAAAVAVTSLKDPAAGAALARLIAARPPSIILNATAFSAMREDATTVLDAADVPVLQVAQAQSTQAAWSSSPRGLAPSDLAMNVVLPELDGRLFTRAIGFKHEEPLDQRLEFAPVRYAPDREAIDYVARLAAAWCRLRSTPAAERRLALMLSDYPARGGRRGYAVGLDTARSVEQIAGSLAGHGYAMGGGGVAAQDVENLLNGGGEALRVDITQYRRYLSALPAGLQEALEGCWGKAEADPSFAGGAFHFPALRAGNLLVLLQPDRGSRSDRKSGYHDMSTPPRHAFVALYAHLREAEAINALVHLGAHGTLEWLPGKALALSRGCWPEAVLGPVPVIYPFIVNNPGEAMQAKRRLGAVTIGHLTPPLATAGLTGALLELEGLIEEYAHAEGLDTRRRELLERGIVDLARSSGFAEDCSLATGIGGREAVARLDASLCDFKELAIGEQLHVFGGPCDGRTAEMLGDAIAATATVERAAVDTAIASCASGEQQALLAALAGRRVAPGPSGAPSRGRADVLPTGRNLTAIDPRAIPTRTAATIGALAADEVVRRYLQDHGEYPGALLLDLWASASLRTGGDDLAQALSYLGARPQWDQGSNRVIGIEVLPLAKLDRPRIDVTLRISGLFRDIFEAQIALFDLAVRTVAALDEEERDNPLAGARRKGENLARVFGGAPGTYGAGAATLALDGPWRCRGELGGAYLDCTTHAFAGAAIDPCAASDFRRRVVAADALVHPQDDRERDILDGGEVADFAGGFAAAAALLGRSPALLHLDTSRPQAPRARSLNEEIARVVRGRLANRRWIASMLAYGYRGVAEIAQGVDALYAFAATAEVVAGHLFDLTHEALLADARVFDAMAESNPAAVLSIVSRLEDARRRGLWRPRRNAVADELARAAAVRVAHPRGRHRPEGSR
jgi:cobaltochelatase CobN